MLDAISNTPEPIYARITGNLKLETIRMPWGNCAFRVSRGRGVPLVLLHPLALSGRIWELTQQIIEGREIIAMDLRGHGESDWAGESFTIEDMAQDVRALLQTLTIDRCDMAGMSMGGCVAMTVASRWPELTRRVALCDTTAWYGPDATLTWAERARAAQAKQRQDLLPFQLDRWFSDRFRKESPSAVQYVADTFLMTKGGVHAQACRALGAFDARPLLSKIRATTLVVYGEEDYATPPMMGEILASGIPGSTVMVCNNLRHFAVLESGELQESLARFFGQ